MIINAYVYEVKNKLTNEIYIGYRYANQRLGIPPKDDLWIVYFTSSKRIANEIEKYGKDTFQTRILFESVDSLECWRKEQEEIKRVWNNPGLLNSKYQDPSSCVEIYRRVGFMSDDARLKMSIAGKGRSKSEEHRRKISEANKGKPQSAEKRRKISEARKGKTPHNKGKSPPKYECPHCRKLVSNANLNKWHNDNCKIINPERHKENAVWITNLASCRI